ncbi:hypothetical protein Tco_0964567 [Tanacetum coccineum]
MMSDDFVHPKLTTHDDEIIHEEDSDEDDSSISSLDDEDSDDEGTNVEGAKTQEEATEIEDQGTLRKFVSNMLNPNQDTGVDDIFRQNTEATSLIDTNITAIMEHPSLQQSIAPNTASIIMSRTTTTSQFFDRKPATTTCSSLQKSS